MVCSSCGVRRGVPRLLYAALRRGHDLQLVAGLNGPKRPTLRSPLRWVSKAFRSGAEHAGLPSTQAPSSPCFAGEYFGASTADHVQPCMLRASDAVHFSRVTRQNDRGNPRRERSRRPAPLSRRRFSHLARWEVGSWRIAPFSPWLPFSIVHISSRLPPAHWILLAWCAR